MRTMDAMKALHVSVEKHMISGILISKEKITSDPCSRAHKQ